MQRSPAAVYKGHTLCFLNSPKGIFVRNVDPSVNQCSVNVFVLILLLPEGHMGEP